MDPASRRAVEEEVEIHAPTMAEAGSRGELAVPVQEIPAQPQ